MVNEPPDKTPDKLVETVEEFNENDDLRNLAESKTEELGRWKCITNG